MLRISVRAVAVIAAIVAFYFVCVAPWRGNLVLQEVSRRSEIAQTADAATAAILARKNLDDLDRIATARRLDTAWYMLRGANCLILDRLPDALDAYTRALRVDDRPELYVNRGIALYHLGRIDETVADLTKAARFDPSVLDQLNPDLRARVVATIGRQ